MKKKRLNKSNSGNPMGRREAILATGSLAALAIPNYNSNNFAGIMNKNEFNTNSELYTLKDQISGQFNTFDLDTKVKAPTIEPGERLTLVNYDKPGILTRLWITFPGWFFPSWDPQSKVDPTILKKLILRIYWDGENFPSVEAPMGDFFGIGHCEYKHYLSKYLGMSSGGFYSYFSMPFEKIRIEVENCHEDLKTDVFLAANYTALKKLPKDAGRFHCQYNSGTNPGQEPMTILKTSGYGHFVGCCISMQAKQMNYLGFLESPEYFYIDTLDRSSPTFTGTGLEDYFNGGWYFRDGEFNGPLHGVPLKDPLRSMISMYRFHESDAVYFKKNLEMTFINPRDYASEFKFSSTAYWYQREPTKLSFNLPIKDKMVDWYRIRDMDHQSIP
ncbi:glycoside hydrolase family 172 protein [Salegentibacter sp. T436]|uniref:glycoside hydrolase family 172 protein n=1 Tax=Salegentibacter sp. T436 TaxID=1729720 RepID=UPI000A732505|nr:glycoside hydrolase family 172 protein [Salegentibacter sp. T436]